MVIARQERERDADLISRLASHDIRYFAGDEGLVERPAALKPLFVDLALASNARLRAALVALLLRHPEYAPSAAKVARGLPHGDVARRRLLLSIVVAAALQSEWSFSLDIYLPVGRRIDAEGEALELGLPSPAEDYGRGCLAEASRLEGEDDIFPVNYVADWENAARRLLVQLAREASAHGS